MVLCINVSIALMALRNFAWFGTFGTLTNLLYVWYYVLSFLVMYFSSHVMITIHFELLFASPNFLLCILLLPISVFVSCRHLLLKVVWDRGALGFLGRWMDISTDPLLPVSDFNSDNGDF